MLSLADQALSIITEYGVLGVVVISTTLIVGWLLKDRRRLYAERNKALFDLQTYMRDQLRRKHDENAELRDRIEDMRGLRDRITTRKVVLHESER